MLIDTNDPGEQICYLEFDPKNSAMDQTNPPTIANFHVIMDEVEEEIDTLEWSAGELVIYMSRGGAAQTYIEFFQDDWDANLKNTDGVQSKPPQSIKESV